MAAAVNQSRRRFFTRRGQNKDVFLPPWSPDSDQFFDQCIRCDDCINHCETGLLKKGSGGFPEADFNKAGCNFCEKCVGVCRHDVLNKDNDVWVIEPELNDKCLALNKIHCRTCQEFCDAEAISFQLTLGAVALPKIDSSSCTGCGECVSGCPVTAISMSKQQEKL